MATLQSFALNSGSNNSSEDQQAISSLLARLEQSGLPQDQLNNLIRPPQEPSLLEKAMSLISKPGYATTSALHALLTGQDPFTAAGKGFAGESPISFRNILEKDLGVPNIPIPFFPDTNTILGFAGDVALDPLTYLSGGTSAVGKQIGKAGARAFLTRAGEEALTAKAATLTERLTRRAAGRATIPTIKENAQTLAEQQLQDIIGTPGGQGLFQTGGLKFMGKKIPGQQVVANMAKELVGGAEKVPVFGKVIDYSKDAVSVVKDIAGYTFKPGYQFTKQIKELTSSQKTIAKSMGLSDAEAAKVFPELAQNTQEALQTLSKSKRFAATQGFKTMIDMFSGINPEEGKILAQAMENVPGTFEKLSENGKQAFTAIKELSDTIGPEQIKYGFISKLVKNFTPRYLTEDARNFLKENLGSSDPAIRGLIKVFNMKKGQERVLVATGIKDKLLAQAKTKAAKTRIEGKFHSTFFGEPIVTNNIDEINGIVQKKLGFNWFEPDLTKALPRYYSDFLTNKAVFDGLRDLPRSVNKESGFKIFDVLGEKGMTKPGYSQFSLDPLKGWQAPKFIVDQVEQTYKILSNDQSINSFLKAYDKGMRVFKFGVTVPFPAFHTQNFIGGQFANYLYGLIPGTPKWFTRMSQARSAIENTPLLLRPVKAGAAQASDKIGEGAVKNMTYKELKDLYEKHGVSQGLFHGDVGPSVYRKIFASDQPIVRRGMTKIMDAGTNTGAFVEDLNRLPIFIDQMIQHGDPARAAKAVMKYQFDYSPEAYTTIEREVFNRLIPFYKFMRGNIPLQLNSLYSRTGRVNAVLKGIRDLGGGEDVNKPEWLRRQFSIPMPPEVAKLFGKNPGDKVFMSLPFPLANLSQVEPRDFLSAMTPLLRVPLELATNQQVFFGNHIWNPDLPPEAQTSRAYPILKPLTDLPVVGKGIAQAIKWREKPVQDSSGNPTGKVYYEADPLLVYGLKQMLGPISRAYILFGQMPDSSIASSLSELALPFGIVPVNPTEAAVSNLAQSRRQLSELVGYLKARGMIPENAQKRKKGQPITLGTAGQKYISAFANGQ